MDKTSPVPQPQTTGVRAVSVRRRGQQLEEDLVVVEEPLEIRVDGKPLVVTMRTPGHDAELAAGFLFAEGVISSGREIAAYREKTGTDNGGAQIRVTSFAGDRIDVRLRDGAERAGVETVEREFRATAACGVCGKEQIEDLHQDLPAIEPAPFSTTLLEALPDRLRERQQLFEATGGIHAAGLFALDGTVLCVREDIGRHNAVDKVIGHFVLSADVPLRERILVVSGRAGFELVQKALKAAIPIMVSVGAASSVAVDMATTAGMSLYSFAGPGRGNLHVASDERS